ncbi:MAG: helix-turn-helix domain-containing protein [Planctomycetaceae bacterium]|nr:helix-turn-helix domain-containing protein [Planctomycetaceae bacterium]
MPNVATALKDEIRRVARKEIRATLGKTKRAVAQYRRDIANLKRLLNSQEKNVSNLRKQLAERKAEPLAEEDELAGMRFSARSIRAQRRRLGLSAADYGKLVGVSAMTVYNWETGKARPRKAQFAALVAVRGIGKREALQRLGAETEQAAGKRKSKLSRA